MNNKIEQAVIYFIYFVVVCFGLSLIIFFGSEVMGSVAFYDFVKDHGSLIGSIVAIIGVGLMIWNQNATTNKVIKAAQEETDRELRKKDRIRHKDDAIKLYQSIIDIFREMDADHTNGNYHKNTALMNAFREVDVVSFGILQSMPEKEYGQATSGILMFTQYFYYIYECLVKNNTLDYAYSDADIARMNGILQNAQRALEEVADSIVLDELSIANGLLDKIKQAIDLLSKDIPIREEESGNFIKAGYLTEIDKTSRDITPIFKVLVQSME